MIVPCDAGVNIDMTFNGTVFTIHPSAYVIKTGDVSTGTFAGCFGAFAIRDARKQSLLYCSSHHSHVEQQTCYLVPPS